MCTFDACDLKLYGDSHSWFEHELECHRLEWCCRFCSQPSFASERQLEAHMRTRHASISSSIQLHSLLQASKQAVDKISAAACLLCDWETSLRDLNSGIATEDTLVVTLDQFRRHLASHMEQLALFALPRSSSDEGAALDSNEAAAFSHSPCRTTSGQVAMSWGTLSSQGANRDQAIPDPAPDSTRIETHDPSSFYIWSKSSPLNSERIFPRYGAGAAQACSKDGQLYLQGGLVDASTVKSDMWSIETRTSGQPWITMQTSFAGPDPRVGHAALLVGNAFIVYGGDTKIDDRDELDSSLWLLNISMHHTSTGSRANFIRHSAMV